MELHSLIGQVLIYQFLSNSLLLIIGKVFNGDGDGIFEEKADQPSLMTFCRCLLL